MAKEFFSEIDIQRTISGFELENDEGGNVRDKAIRILRDRRRTRDVVQRAALQIIEQRNQRGDAGNYGATYPMNLT